MWFKGTKDGVEIWFVLWINPITHNYSTELYNTPMGLRKWLTKSAFRDLSVVRIGRMVLSETGWEEKGVWKTREAFLSSRGSD